MHEHTGRGPTRSRTTINPNVVIVVLRDCLNTSEQRLVREGRHAVVWQVRRAYQQAMRKEMIAIIERAMGRGVEAFLTDVLLEPDITIAVFVMEESSSSV